MEDDSSADEGVSHSASSSSKRLKSYTVLFKLEAIRRVKNGESLRETARSIGITEKMLRNWRKKEHQLLCADRKTDTRRIKGGGRKAMYPAIDQRLYEYFLEQRQNKNVVTYSSIRNFVRSPNFGIPLPPGFLCSDKYIFSWTRRFQIVSRRITHRGQIDKRSKKEILATMKNYFTEIQQKTSGLEDNRIFNMDETPCYIDMARDTTLSFKGDKNVDGTDTGHRKSRYTVCLCISLDGRVIKTMIIFRNLRNVPKVNVDSNKIVIAVNQSGSMDSSLAKRWMNDCFATRGPYFSQTKSLLIWDAYGSHRREDVVAYLKDNFKSEMVLIPAKATCFAQPLDVAINAGFKAALRNEWDAWVRDTPAEFTPKGYRKRPSYQAIVDMVSNALDHISVANIKRAFECCGIASKGRSISIELLNERLKAVLSSENEAYSDGLIQSQTEEQEEEDDLYSDEYV